MQFLNDKIDSLRIGWNDRPLDERDFYSICKRFRIGVTEMPLVSGGFYYRVLGKDYIAVNSRLSGAKKLIVLFHELGHFLLHTPESGATANFHGVGRRTRQEIEADAFALCAIIPRSMLEDRTIDELINDGIDPETLSERVNLYRVYSI